MLNSVKPEMWPLIFDAVAEPIMVIDRSYRVRLMNRAARESHCGCVESGGLEFCYQISHCRNSPCDGAEHPCPLITAIESGEPVTVTHSHKDVFGRDYVMEINASPFYDTNGNVEGIVEIGRDVTEKMRLNELKEKLDTKLAIQQKEESILTLASGIAHDFNNILMSVLGNAELLKLRHSNSERDNVLTDNIIQSSERMASLTNQLLAYARGGMYRQQDVAVDKVAREALSMALKEKADNISIDIDIPDDLWHVYADPGHLNQALMNVINNAMEAMAQTGGRLHIRAWNDVKTSVWKCSTLKHEHPAGDYVNIVISDTGEGIPGALHQKIFDPFYTTKFLGRGLGLAATAGILQSHKGCIEVESEPGRGAVFHIYLLRTAVGAVEPPKKNSRVKIIVVDDEPQIITLLRDVLTQFEYDVATAGSGEEALDLFRKEKDLIGIAVLDIQMPGMSGRSLFQEMKNIKPSLKVLISSGYDENVALAGMDNTPPDGFIKKPFRVESLKQMIDKVLKQ